MVTSVQVDYLALGDVLKARIAESMPEARVVRGRTMDAVMQAAQGDLTVHIIYVGDELTPTDAKSMQIVGQLWMLILAVKYAGADLTGEGNQEIAGPLIVELLDSMLGWQPELVTKPLRRVQGPGVVYHNNFGYYPYVFRAEICYKGRR